VDHNQLQEFRHLKMMSRYLFGSGLIIEAESERVMPHGDMASRTLGTLNKGHTAVFTGTWVIPELKGSWKAIWQATTGWH
jgi:hypothetical protein